MKEIKLKNCYDLYKEKFDKSIKDGLEQTIYESQKEIDLKLETFIKRYFKDPTPKESSRSERIIKEVVNSKNCLLNLINSPYTSLYFKHKDSVPKLARSITWYWLSLPKPDLPLPDYFKYQNLKDELVSIGYHYSIYSLNDWFLANLKEYDPTVPWPDNEHLEIYQIKQLEEKLKQSEEKIKQLKKEFIKQKELHSELEEYDYTQYNILKEAKRKLEKELEQKEYQLVQSRSELKLLKGPFFFQEDKLYENYVFGDILPELKSVYNLLKEYQLYDSNWGYFCYCLTWDNSCSGISPHQKLTLNTQKSEFTANDVGYILYLLKKKYMYESQLPFLKWLTLNIIIISGHGKPFETEEEYSQFSERNIRSFKNGKSRPKFYIEINQKLHSLL